MRKYIYILIYLSTQFIALSIDKDIEFEKLKAKFTDANTIIILASNSTQNEINLTSYTRDTIDIKITRGNKYQIKSSNRILTSDGDTLWNYSKEDNNVIISTFNSFSSETSIENIFFEKINNMKVVSLKSGNDTQLGAYYKLELISKVDDEKVYIYLSKLKKLIALEIVNDFSEQIWHIIKFKVSKENANYNFIPPKDIELIDLR